MKREETQREGEGKKRKKGKRNVRERRTQEGEKEHTSEISVCRIYS